MKTKDSYGDYSNCTPYVSRDLVVNELVHLLYRLEKTDPIKAFQMMKKMGMLSRHDIESHILNLQYHRRETEILREYGQLCPRHCMNLKQ